MEYPEYIYELDEETAREEKRKFRESLPLKVRKALVVAKKRKDDVDMKKRAEKLMEIRHELLERKKMGESYMYMALEYRVKLEDISYLCNIAEYPEKKENRNEL